MEEDATTRRPHYDGVPHRSYHRAAGNGAVITVIVGGAVCTTFMLVEL